MTVAATPPPLVEYIENGVTKTHPIPFQFLNAADIFVTRIIAGVETALAQPAGYTVTGGNGLVGSITKATGGTNGATLRIVRKTPIQQLTDYIQGDDFPADSHERALDRLTFVAQELAQYLYTVEQLQDLIAAALRDGTNIDVVYDDAAGTITINNLYGDEQVRDAIATALRGVNGIEITADDAGNTISIKLAALPAEVAFPTLATMLEGGTGIDLIKNPATGKITIACTVQSIEGLADMILLEGDQQDGGGSADTGQISPEIIRDTIAAALVAGGGVSIVNDDAANTITITAAAGLSLEEVQDAVAAMLQPGAGMDAFTYDDAAGTITIASSGGAGGGGLTTEDVRDAIGAALVAGVGVSIAVDDAANTITLTADVDASFKGLAVITKNAGFAFDATHHGRSINYTGSSANALLDLDATTPLGDGWVTVIRHAGPAGTVLTIDAAAGVSLKDGSIAGDVQLNVDEIATIERWAADDFTISVKRVA